MAAAVNMKPHAPNEPSGSERAGLPTVAHEVVKREGRLAGWTGLEPAASGVTGRRSNQLNYHPKGDFSESSKCKVQSLQVSSEVTCQLRPLNFPLPSGGRCRTRTCDSRRVKPVLYH